MSFQPHEMRELLLEVQLAPSAHNTQPALWTTRGQEFCLSFDESRALPVADSQNSDLLLSLGAQIEALDLALYRRWFEIETLTHSDSRWTISIRSRKEDDSLRDRLSRCVDERRTYRGVYEPLSAEVMSKVQQEFGDSERFLILSEPKTKRLLAQWYDEVTLQFMRDPGYLDELYRWLRFRRDNPDWATDGLNAEAMALNAFEAFFARHILSPRNFRMIDRWGLASPLIAEAGKNRSAAFFLVLLVREEDLRDPISLGRRFYSDWLRATALGVSLCPVSNLVDDPKMKERIERELAVKSPLRIFKLFRAGRAPGDRPGRYRLPIEKVWTVAQKEKA